MTAPTNTIMDDDNIPLAERLRRLQAQKQKDTPQPPSVPKKRKDTIIDEKKTKDIKKSDEKTISSTPNSKDQKSITSKEKRDKEPTNTTQKPKKDTIKPTTQPQDNSSVSSLQNIVKQTKPKSTIEKPKIKSNNEPAIVPKNTVQNKDKPKSESSASQTTNPEISESAQENDEDEEYKWWESQQGDNSIKWDTLQHTGPYFPPLYEAINIPLIYEGKELYLEPEAEEVAGFFGALLATDHAKNHIFIQNFFEDFCNVLKQINSKHTDTIKSFEKCDFSRMYTYFESQREMKRNSGKEAKEAAKLLKKEIDEKYGYCLLDGRREKVGNFRIEPPGLFRGRGKHPKAGKLKLRVFPEQVTINIGENTTAPEPPAGHQWGSVQHDNTVTWLATWTENVNKSQKYVFLAPGSSLKGQSDLKKFETARQLKKHVDSIRAKNTEELHSKDMLTRQRATALWLIDHFALRAGNEKGDDEADTVGCCSLRCEHVTLKPPRTVVFDFLGKDSIRYYREMEIDAQIFKNLGIFMKPPKTPSDAIFDRLTTTTLNKYLSDLMPGLTAKVFRTFNASFTFQRELDAGTISSDAINDSASVPEKLLAYNRANRQVAILCNHQRSIPKTHTQTMEKLKEKLLFLKLQRFHIRQTLKTQATKAEQKALELNVDESDLEPKSAEKLYIEREQERLDKQKAKNEDKEPVDAEKHVHDQLSKLTSANRDSLMKRYLSINERIASLRLQMTDRDENKTTALGTSKTNYIDPRITTAWCAKHNVSIEKLFNKSLRDKFKWAMGVDQYWTF